jgi:hypothetical protein
MRKLSLALAGAVALASASAAQATITVVDGSTNVDVTRVHQATSATGTAYINYQSPDPLSPGGEGGSFSNMLTFYNDTAGIYNLSVLTQLAANGMAEVNFTTLTLTGAGIPGGMVTFGGPTSNGTAWTYAISNLALGVGTYTVNLAGTTNMDGAFQGTVKFNLAGGVPEPATWGLMLLGFGLVGGSMRRRRAQVALPQLA